MNKDDLINKLDANALMMRPLNEWRIALAEECQVYCCEEGYLGKYFDQINYKFCSKDEAKEIVTDNVYALLRYKYFTKSSEEIDKKIDDIVSSFVKNLKTTLRTISFNKDDENYVKYLPDYCIAFRNGVYNFKDDDWFFRYKVYNLPELNKKIYLYDKNYVINWYFNYDFEPLPIKVTETSISEFISIMKTLTEEEKNYCFELVYNICHDKEHKFDLNRFEHLCEILGYSLLQSFSQHFVMLIGSGQNGKNSLFDGCFTNRLIPRPASIDMQTIEEDRFITGSLENKAHNIFLETNADTIKNSKMIKALTGSMYQSIESKGIAKYSGIINCKHIFAGNDRANIKFNDTTVGFTRRINLFEIYYQWDKNKRFLTLGDYYDTTFSDSLYELTSNPANTSMYIYLGMYGIMSATRGFTTNFKFIHNEWQDNYFNINMDLRDNINKISINNLLNWCRESKENQDIFIKSFYNLNSRSKIPVSKYVEASQLVKIDENSNETEEIYIGDELWLNEISEFYMDVRLIKEYLHNTSIPRTFTSELMKIYNPQSFDRRGANLTVVKAKFNEKGLLQII